MKERRKSSGVYTFDKVSDWFDADGFKVFLQVVNSGDIVELRSTKCSHWGIVVRMQTSVSTSSPKSNKAPKDEIMVYHLIHSSTSRGQVGRFTLEEFWQPDARIRINNTNISNLYGTSRLSVPKADVLQNAFMAHASTTLKWHTCTDFIRWSSSIEPSDDLRSTASYCCSSGSHSNSSIASSNTERG